MYLARKNWEREAEQMGAEILENSVRVVATIRGVVVGRWDKARRTGELRRQETRRVNSSNEDGKKHRGHNGGVLKLVRRK